MIIDAKTVIITFVIIGVAMYLGLGAIRSFALSIAQENHDANLAADMTEEARRARREKEADDAATQAFAKVAPLLPVSVASKGTGLPVTNTQSAPSSGNSLNVDITAVLNEGDEEAPTKIATI